MTELDVEGKRCLSFTVESDWAHFRRIDTTNDKQTYRVVPRTTAAGLIAAILGEPRDSYYDEFSREFSAMGIVPLQPLRTMQIPMLTVPTSKDGQQGQPSPLVNAAGIDGKIISPKALEDNRKRRTFEYLCNPAYRIHLVLDNERWFDRLVDRLDARTDNTDPDSHHPIIRPVYTPSLGKSECLAEITNPIVTKVTDASPSEEVDSTLPEHALIPSVEASYQMERSPAYMEREGHGRKTTGYVSYAYTTDASPLLVNDISAHEIDGDTVYFL